MGANGAPNLGAYIAMMIVGVGLNFEGALRYGLTSWGWQNLIAIPMLAAGLAAFFVDRRWVQIAAPLVLGGTMIAYPILFYPVLK